MKQRTTQHNNDLDIKIPLGNIIINVFCINYEAPIPGWGYGNHSHSSYELHFIPYGRGLLKVSNKIYDIEPGIFYLTGPGVFHDQKAERQNPMGEYCINFEFEVKKQTRTKNKLYLQEEIDDILNRLLSTNFWFGKDKFATTQLFEKLILEMENQCVGYYTYIQNLISQIILNALRCYSPQEKSGYAIPKKILNDSRRYIIDKYFEHIDKPLSRKELACTIGTSIRQLNRILQEYYSMSFKEKLFATRLEQAKHLLLSTELRIQDIAFKTGFSSQSYFNKAFKEYYGTSPGKYRSGHK
jgi:AraC-like DNA-binding protein